MIQSDSHGFDIEEERESSEGPDYTRQSMVYL